MATIKQNRWTSSGVIYPSYLWEGEAVTGMGGAIYLNSKSASLSGGGDETDCAYFIGNSSGSNGGAIALSSSTIPMSLSYLEFRGNTAGNGGAIYFKSVGLTLENVWFTGNTAAQGGAIFNDGAITLTNVLFSGNSATTSGGAIHNKADRTVTLNGATFYTEYDTVNNLGVLNFSGTNYLNASVTGTGTLNVEENAVLIFGNTANIEIAGLTFGGNNAMTFTGSTRVKFNVVQDLSDVAITVDGSNFTSGTVTVALGVNAIGGYRVIGSDNSALFLRVGTTNNSLVLYERNADLAGGTVVEGNYKGTGDSNLVTGGVVENAFFGTTQTSGNVRTVFTGGTVANSMIGGALVLTGSSAGLDNVMLDIHDGVSLLGGPSNGGMNYVAGYAYGANGAYDLDTTPTLSVTQSTLNFSGSEISGNFYAGAHARRGAYADVDETVVTVTGGYIEKLYGGGWAERGDKTYAIEGGTAARSDVGTATVTISGGTVERLYAGGGNAFGGYTDVGTANLTISGGQVDFVFLGGRNINSSVGDATLTITGSAQTLTRISGRNDCGADRTASGTLNVQTNVTVDYLDDVNVINVSEYKTLEITQFASYDITDPLALKVNLITDGFGGEDWTVLSGAYMDVFHDAEFFVNDTAYTEGGVVIGDVTYVLTKGDDSITFGRKQLA